MSKIQWEYYLVEKPFCQQLKAMGWQWIEGDTDIPDFTERQNFREVLLKGRLAAALHKLNLRDGRPWLDDDRIRRIIEKLERAEGHRLMEINESATKLLLKGTEIDGLPDWNSGRNQPVRFIDFENPLNNDFLVINQFKVELTSGRGHVIPDAVLFVNGIPVGVAEFKSPGIENPLQEAINQLLRYTNQRREIWPTLYTDNEGVELGVLPQSPEEPQAAQELAAAGAEKSDWGGIPLFFRQRDKRPEVLRGGVGASLQSQQILTAGMLRPAHLLDLIRNFTVFEQVEGKTRTMVARYQQFRAIHNAVTRLQEGRTKAQGADRDERGGIVWHTQGSGKSLSMVFLVRKMRMTPRLKRFKVVVVTDWTDLQEQLGATAQLSGESVRPTDQDLKSRESPTAMTQRLE